jgi:tetratricopeptide (TPR) repeat protein
MYNKAVVFLNLSQYDKAADILKDFLVYEPDDYSALTAIADCYLKLGQGDKAEKYMKMLLELDQNNIEAYSSLAYISLVRQEYDKSLDYLRIIIGKENVNYNLLEDDLFIAFQKTGLPEFLVYYVAAAYFIDDQEGLSLRFEQLLEFDELWQNMLYKLVPELNFFTDNT